LGNAHNLSLQLAVELGVPAALLMCVVCLWRTRQTASKPLVRPWPRVSLRIATAATALRALGCIGFDCARVSQLYLPAEKRWVA
jgi:hypothetical protein